MKKLKKLIIALSAVLIMALPITVSALSVSVNISTSGIGGITVGSKVTGTDCISVQNVIDATDGSTLAGGSNYATNDTYLTNSISYTGFKWAEKALGVAQNKAKKVVTQTKYW